MLGQAWWLKFVILEFRRPGQKHLHGFHSKCQVSIGYRKRVFLKNTERKKGKEGRKEERRRKEREIKVEGEGRERNLYSVHDWSVLTL